MAKTSKRKLAIMKRYYRRHQQERKEAARKYQAANRDKVKARMTRWVRERRWAELGVTPEAYEAMLQVQNGHCAICPCTPEENGKMLAVDHDHVSGRVRGLLCRRCNLGLGNFRDMPGVLRAAATYLERG